MAQPSVPTIYVYKPKKFIMVSCFVFFGICAWVLAHVAQTEEGGLTLVIYRHIVEFSLSPYEAKLFYWVLCFVSGLFSIVGLFGFYKAFTSKAQILIMKNEIHIPSSIFVPSKIAIIAFEDIHSVEVHQVNKNRSIKIIHKDGKAHVNQIMLEKKEMLDEIFEILRARVNLK
ncbi:MAG: hypothetical protein K2Y18_08435 [Alphaproteobacteria bacterium]|jgi:hypothetical protein|nr:hypothetical protein [Alphaproteobacteria bacterium]